MIEYDWNFGWEADAKEQQMMMDAFGSIKYEKEHAVVGYYNLPKDSQYLVSEVACYSALNSAIKSADTIVVIGIGGSSLGTKAIDSMLRPRNRDAKRILFLENPDPIDLTQKFASIEKKNSIFIVISKSGYTVETTSIFKTVISRFDIDLDNADKERVMVVTDEGSSLCRFADFHGLKLYTIPSNVGGRFSVLSAAGIVPLTLAGYDTCTLLKGASEMIKRFFTDKEDHLTNKAAFIVSHKKEYVMNVLFSYGSCLEDFNKWYMQLWGESLGKIDQCGNRVGLTPIGQIGSVDQHSFLQLIMEGPRDKTVTFLKTKTFGSDIVIPDIKLKHMEESDFINGHTFNELINTECDTTYKSVADLGIPADAITLDSLSESNIGEIVIYYELLTSLVGAMLDIDTYDQPSVELEKSIVIKNFKESDNK